MSKYNKAWAAGLAQALVQLVAAFVPFEPDLEQALGVVVTAVVVWLVPNVPQAQPTAAVGSSEQTTSRMPARTIAAALALGLLASACAGFGDKAANTLLERFRI